MICDAVKGCGVWISQPDVVDCRPSWCTACSVITVFGAEVPGGRALTCSMFGLARHDVFGQGNAPNLPPPGGPLLLK